MSAFLGPIHYWLYNKIQIQLELVNDIITFSNDKNLGLNLQSELDSKYGTSETRPLDEVIDTGNIHGWLQTQVTQVEYKLAYSITKILEKDTGLFKNLEQIFEDKGKQKAPSENTDNAAKIYRAISDCLLDGMPCDHANLVIEENDEKVIWERTTCVHKSYWEEIGGDIKIYYTLREAFIKGFLSTTSIVYEKIDDTTSMIKVVD